MNNRQFAKEQVTMRSSHQVISLRRTSPGHQRGKRQPNLLTRKNYGKDEVISEGNDEEERRENDGDENDGDGEVIKSTSGSPGDDRP